MLKMTALALLCTGCLPGLVHGNTGVRCRPDRWWRPRGRAEANPILGSHPSPATVVEYNLAWRKRQSETIELRHTDFGASD
jgi:hypothetical protein